MPKKATKNAYFYFMIDFREEEKKKGNIYANLKEVQQAADPLWRASSAAVRAKYEKIAKDEKTRHNIPDQKFTTFGVPFSAIEHQERLAKEAVDREVNFIQNFVFQNSIGHKFLDEKIYLIDVNALCETNAGYVFGEFSVIRFNIRNGIIDHIHRIINPPEVPIGYASDIRVGCEQLALEAPDPEGTKSDYLKILALIVTYLKENDPDSNVLPPMYTMPEKEDQVLHFIGQLCHATLEDEEKFRIFKVDVLFFYLINTIKKHNNEGFPKVSLALAALRKDAFKYSPGLGCNVGTSGQSQQRGSAKASLALTALRKDKEYCLRAINHHEAGERPTECCKARVTRWAYTILDSCCPVVGVEAVPGQHLPAGIDVEAVLNYKEKKMEARRYPHAPPSASSRASSVNDSYDTPSQSTASSVARPPTRALPPLRRPTVETLQFQSSLVAPELSNHSVFPPLSVAGSGRGSGRNINTNMENLNLGK